MIRLVINSCFVGLFLLKYDCILDRSSYTGGFEFINRHVETEQIRSLSAIAVGGRSYLAHIGIKMV